MTGMALTRQGDLLVTTARQVGALQAVAGERQERVARVGSG